MAINTTLAGLSTNQALNGPDGASDVPSSLDDAIRYALSFIAQLRDGTGFTVTYIVSGAAAATGRLTVTGSARTVPVSVAYAAGLTIDAATSNVFYIGTMTGNIATINITNPSDGQTIMLRCVQDATGGRNFTGNVKASGTIDTTANAISQLTLTYYATGARWEGAWNWVPA